MKNMKQQQRIDDKKAEKAEEQSRKAQAKEFIKEKFNEKVEEKKEQVQGYVGERVDEMKDKLMEDANNIRDKMIDGDFEGAVGDLKTKFGERVGDVEKMAE